MEIVFEFIAAAHFWKFVPKMEMQGSVGADPNSANCADALGNTLRNKVLGTHAQIRGRLWSVNRKNLRRKNAQFWKLFPQKQAVLVAGRAANPPAF